MKKYAEPYFFNVKIEKANLVLITIMEGLFMKFCSKCGAQMGDDKAFCSNCGNKLRTGVPDIQPNQESLVNGVYNQPVQNYIQNPVKTRKRITKLQMIVLIVAVSIIALGTTGYFVGASMTSKDKVISDFSKALESKNPIEIMRYLKSSDPAMKIDEPGVKSFIKYLEKNPNSTKDIINSISIQSALADSKIDSAVNLQGGAQKNTSVSILTLVKDGKSLLIYDRFMFEVKPCYINVTTNYKDTSITVDDKEMCKADSNAFSKKIGPFMPGIYTLKAVYKGQYVNIEKSQEAILNGVASANANSQYVLNVNMPLNAYTVNIESNFNDAKLFINDKDSGLLVRDAKQFGPVPKDGSASLQAQKEFPWGIGKSQVVKTDGKYSIFLDLSPVNDSVTNSIMGTANEYVKSFVEAIIARDAGKLVNNTQKDKDRQKSRFDYMVNDKQYYKGKLTKMEFDTGTLEIYIDSNTYKARITGRENYDSTFYYEGNSDALTTQSNSVSNYEFIYDETSKKWLIDNVSSGYYYNPENNKEFIMQ